MAGFNPLLEDILMQAETGDIGDSLREDMAARAAKEEQEANMPPVPPPSLRDPGVDKLMGLISPPRATASTPTEDPDVERQRGLNVFPMDPAINAYPGNEQYSPQTADLLKRLGMGPFTSKTEMPPEVITGELPKPGLSLKDTLPTPVKKMPVDMGPYDPSEEADANAAADAVMRAQGQTPPPADAGDVELKEAQKEKRDQQMLQAILKASNNIGTAISGQGHIKADMSSIEAFDPLVGSKLADLKEGREQEKATIELQKLRDQMTDEKYKNDPNS